MGTPEDHNNGVVGRSKPSDALMAEVIKHQEKTMKWPATIQLLLAMIHGGHAVSRPSNNVLTQTKAVNQGFTVISWRGHWQQVAWSACG